MTDSRSKLFALFAAIAVLCVLIPAAANAADDVPAGGRYFDDDGNVHEGSIEAIATAGITYGCNPPRNTSYCPDAAVTRAQMAAFLVRALGLTDMGPDNTFIDDDASIFEANIERLVAAGITKGCNPPANDHFCPDDLVTRGQMAAFLVRAFGYSAGGASNLFTDDDGSVFETSIDKLAVAGVTLGCNPPANTQFCPDAIVTRDQMATFLARALELSRPAVPARPIESDGVYLNVWGDAGDKGCTYDNGERCRLTYNVSGEFYIGTGWYMTDWSQASAAAQASFRSDGVRVEATFNDAQLNLHDWGFMVHPEEDVADKWWTFVFPDWLTGGTLEVFLIDEEFDYVWTAVVTIVGDGPGFGAPSTTLSQPAVVPTDSMRRASEGPTR